MPTHSQVKLGSGASAGPLVGRARSWGLWLQGQGSQIWCHTTGGWGQFLTWLQGLGCPEACVSLMIGAGSWSSWLRASRCLRAGVGLLVGEVMAHWVLWLVLAYWCVGWVFP